MILELDCGNSLIKWRLLDAKGAVASSGLAESTQQLLEMVVVLEGRLRACRLVSVRSDEETAALVGLLRREFGVDVVCAQPAASLAGVRNGYQDFARLGLDRWLAAVGAYQLSGGRACLVLDLGTAITSDFVTKDGEHLGGYICPGMPLMRRELSTHTRRIRYDDAVAQQALLGLEPGRNTAEAVERGCALMLRGFALTQLDVARNCFGESFQVYLTGGDAALVGGCLPQAHLVADLVFRGLAEACPVSGV